jgi:flagellar motor protein MotB
MKDFKNPIKEFSTRKLMVTIALTALLAGCSSVPDALNPVEWYKGARDAITSDGEEKKDTKGKPTSRKTIPGEKDGFPKLSSVPEKPNTSVEEERKRIAAGLISDRNKARKYSNEVIRRQGDSTRTIPKPPPVNKVQPAPKTQSKTMPKVKVKAKAVPKAMVKPVIKAPPKLVRLVAPKPALVKQSAASKMPKLRVGSQMAKIPALNPNAPKLGAVPGLAAALGQNETIVVSGRGVQTMNLRTRGRTLSSAVGGSANALGRNTNLQGSYQVATILFANGSSVVRAPDRRVLRQVIVQHKKVGGTIRVVGHASRRTKTNDPIRHKMVNFQVSTARADRVAQELIKMGVKANKLFIGSVSDSEPLYHEYMPSGEAGNRRTEIFIDF